MDIFQKILSILNISADSLKHNTSILINAFDQNHRILFWNKKCEHYFGIEEKDALGKRLEDIIPYTLNNKKMIYLERALAGEQVYNMNDRYDKKEGRYDQIVLPLKNECGEVEAVVNIVKEHKEQPDQRLELLPN